MAKPELLRPEEYELTSLELPEAVNIFGIQGKRVSSTMEGISLRLDGNIVVVRSTRHEGKEVRVMPGGHVLTLCRKEDP